MTIDVQGLDAVESALRSLVKVAPDAARSALVGCGRLAQREAKRNAPKSPTNKILSSTLKRKKRTAQKMHPGGLEKSIDFDMPDGMTASVFVAQNSFCVNKKSGFNYAKRIHDEKGITWRNRGPGTVAKGARADEKFIERAIRENGDRFQKIFDDELRKALPK